LDARRQHDTASNLSPRRSSLDPIVSGHPTDLCVGINRIFRTRCRCFDHLVETEGTHSAGFIGSDFEKAKVAQSPLGRIGQPDDIAEIAVFLASNDSRWLTGEQLLATGGIR
jgi:hypothetical protein